MNRDEKIRGSFLGIALGGDDERSSSLCGEAQTALYTATGLIYCYTMAIMRGFLGDYTECVKNSLRDYSCVLRGWEPEKKHSWLVNIPEMRKGGGEEISAFSLAAVCGMFFDPEKQYCDSPEEYICVLCADISGQKKEKYVGAGFFAALMNRLIYTDYYGEKTLEDNIERALKTAEKAFGDIEAFAILKDGIKTVLAQSMLRLMDADALINVRENEDDLKELKTALFCALRRQTDIKLAIKTARNCSFEAGALTGCVFGALLGEEVFESVVLQKEILLTVADDLYYTTLQSDYDADFENDDWAKKYIFVNYKGEKNE